MKIIVHKDLFSDGPDSGFEYSHLNAKYHIGAGIRYVEIEVDANSEQDAYSKVFGVKHG